MNKQLFVGTMNTWCPDCQAVRFITIYKSPNKDAFIWRCEKRHERVYNRRDVPRTPVQVRKNEV